MHNQIYKIDSNGFRVDFKPVKFIDDNPAEELSEGYIVAPHPHGLRKPKWTGTEWVEGESEEEKTERESQQLLESLNPTERELSKAERELEMIELLLEMGLI